MTKEDDPDSLLKGFDYTGTFNEVIPDVELEPGNNVFTLLAKDKVTGLSGASEWSGVVPVTTDPVDETFTFDDFHMSGALSPITQETIWLTLTMLGGETVSATLLETGNNTGEFRNGDDSIILELQQKGTDPITGGTILGAEMTVSKLDSDFIVSQRPFDLTEKPNLPGQFDGGFTQTRLPEEMTDFRHSVLGPTSTFLLQETEPLDPVCYALEIIASPPVLLQTQGLRTANGLHPVVQVDGHAYLANSTQPTKREVLFAALKKSVDFRNVTVGSIIAGYTDYEIGLAQGFAIDGAWGDIEGIGEAAWFSMKYLSPIGQAIQAAKLTMADGSEKAMFARKALKAGAFIIQAKLIADEFALNLPGVQYAILTGDDIFIRHMSKEAQFAVACISDLVLDVCTKLVQMSWRDRGRIVGQAAWMAFITVATEGIGVALKAGKLGVMCKVLAKLEKVLPESDETRVMVRELASTYEKCKTMCFVAGTDVMTADGLKDIETIVPGDMVLSRDPETGQQCYKPVLQTFITHPSALYHVDYSSGGELVCTGVHPFYVVNRHEFVPAEELVVGDELSLADGTWTFVTGLTVEQAPAGRTYTTYNFEVQDYHTYFVGAEGVWVHNMGLYNCEALAETFERVLKQTGSASEAFGTIAADATSWIANGFMSGLDYARIIEKFAGEMRPLVAGNAMADLAEWRRILKLGDVGTELGGKEFVLARLEGDGVARYAINIEKHSNPAGMNAYSYTHSEMNLLIDGAQRGTIRGKRLKMYVDKEPCKGCQGMFRNRMQAYGIEDLEVFGPNGYRWPPV